VYVTPRVCSEGVANVGRPIYSITVLSVFDMLTTEEFHMFGIGEFHVTHAFLREQYSLHFKL
jgi:hypothetical protein